MSFAICCVPVSPLRAEAFHKSEMVSQLLFGERCVILEEGKEQWIRIKCLYDGYEGWCQGGQFTQIDESLYLEDVRSLTSCWENKLLYNGQPMHIPLGCALPGVKNGHASWGHHTVNYQGGLSDTSTAEKSNDLIRQHAFQFLNTPYLWGGKSVFGVDCSGYVQNVFKFLNIHLWRDAWQQAAQGEVIAHLPDARCGDLAFFDNDQGRITHVGLLLNNEEIIHASVKVRVDKIDEAGIIHSETGQRTHNLRMIRRYF